VGLFQQLPHLRPRLIGIVIAIALVLAIGTAGFVFIEHYPVFDAFYMSLTTITTVGYGEIRGLSRAGRVFNSFLILFGVTSLLLAMGAMTQTIIELEFSRYFARRRVKRMIDKLNGHYIVCGFGKVGRGAALELRRARAKFIVIERSDDKVELAIRDGMLGVHGDATRDENLRELGVDRAKGLIAALSTDADNLFLVISAKALNPKMMVSARVIDENSEQKLKRAGADTTVASYNVTGTRLAQGLLRPHVAQFLDSTTMNLGPSIGIEQLIVSPQSEYNAKSLAQLNLRRELGVIILAIRRSTGIMLFNPDADERIDAGDVLIAMGENEKLSKLEKMLT
jgi:voltage-gated potassium channel